MHGFLWVVTVAIIASTITTLIIVKYLMKIYIEKMSRADKEFLNNIQSLVIDLLNDWIKSRL